MPACEPLSIQIPAPRDHSHYTFSQTMIGDANSDGVPDLGSGNRYCPQRQDQLGTTSCLYASVATQVAIYTRTGESVAV